MHFRLITFALSLLFVSCSITTTQTNTLLDEVIEHRQPRTTLQKLKNHPLFIDNPDITIVDDVLLAIEHYQSVDSLNTKSTALFKKANQYAQQSSNLALQQWINSEIGFYYYSYSNYLQAAPFFIAIDKIINNDLLAIALQQQNILIKTAYYFETMGEYDKSKKIYNIALLNTQQQEAENASLYYSLANIALKQHDYIKSQKYFEKSALQALLHNDSLRYAKSQGGLGLVHYGLNRTDSAVTYLKKDIVISQMLHEDRNVMYAQLQLGKIYFEQGYFTDAKKTFEQAYEVAASKAYLIGYKQELIQYLIQISSIEQDLDKEIFYRRDLDQANALMENKEGDKVINQINWEQINTELEIHKNTLDQVLYQRLLLLTTIALLLVIAFMSFRFSKGIIRAQAFKYETKLLAFELDNIKSEQKLKQNDKTISSYQEYLTEKNRQIKTIEKELKLLKNDSISTFPQSKTNIQDLIKSHLMTEENWQLFKLAFSREQPEYLAYLKEQFPSLTETNLRIVLLQKIGLNNLETANLLGVTIEAIKKAKQRLKKKYNTQFQTILNIDNLKDLS